MQMIKLEAYKLLLSKIERNSIWVRLIFTNFYFVFICDLFRDGDRHLMVHENELYIV